MQLYCLLLGSIIGTVFLYGFIYALEAKLLSYRRNVQSFIFGSALSCGATKIHKKYRIFFNRKDYANLLTGEVITFEEFEEIIALRDTNFSQLSEEKDS